MPLNQLTRCLFRMKCPPTMLPEAQQIDWENYPDGIRIEPYTGETFTAHVMIVRDPSKVYLAASSNPLSMDTPGARMDEAMERENAIAAVNAGPFFDDGTASQAVGSVPSGLALSEDAIIWNDQQISEYGFRSARLSSPARSEKQLFYDFWAAPSRAITGSGDNDTPVQSQLGTQ